LTAELIERGAPVAPYSRLLLEFAAHLRRIDLAEILFEHGADARGLSVAPFTRDLALAELALRHGASVDEPAAWGDWPPIVYLSRGDRGEHPERVAWLLAHGADVEARGPHRLTALHVAARAGFTRVIEVLLAHGADVNARTEDGATPFDLAERAGRTEAAALLYAYGGGRR